MRRPSDRRRAPLARRPRSPRGFVPAIQALEARQLLAVDAPLDLTATPALNDRINLAWTDAATNEQGYRVERSADGVSFVQVGTVGANQTTYAATGLAPGAAYHFRVRAYNASEQSPYSAVVVAATPAIAPGAPANLTATAASSSQITLSWADPGDNEQGYKVERSADGVTFIQVGTAPANATSYTDTNLAANTTYTYRVRAYNAAGDSAYSNPSAAATPLLNAPTNLSAAVVSGSRIDLTWTDPATNEAGFKVERSTDGVTFVEVGTAPANSWYSPGFQAMGLAPGTTYHFRVRATHAAGGDLTLVSLNWRTALPGPPLGAPEGVDPDLATLIARWRPPDGPLADNPPAGHLTFELDPHRATRDDIALTRDRLTRILEAVGGGGADPS